MILELLTVLGSLGPLDVPRIPVERMHVTDCRLDPLVLKLIRADFACILNFPLAESLVEGGPVGQKVLAERERSDQSERCQESKEEDVALAR